MFNGLLNLIEKLYAENEQLKEVNQKLKDEINHLKGEQGKPDIKKRNRNNSDHSSDLSTLPILQPRKKTV